MADDSTSTDIVPVDAKELRNRRERIARHFKSLETRIQKVEAYQAANLELAVDMFKQRLEILDALAQNFKNPKTGEFDPQRIKWHRDELRIYLNEMQNVEKQAGLIPTKKEQRTVVVTLADRFRQFKEELDGEGDFIEAELVDD